MFPKVSIKATADSASTAATLQGMSHKQSFVRFALVYPARDPPSPAVGITLREDGERGVHVSSGIWVYVSEYPVNTKQTLQVQQQ